MFWIDGHLLADGRLHLPDVARRADRRVRPGQRHLADHPRRHRRPHAAGDRRCWSSRRNLSGSADADQADERRARSSSSIASFVFIVAGSILITQAQRRIPIQQAKHTRGRRVYGGQRQYLPLRVNHGGVMPIIFAQSLMLFPGVLFGWLNGVDQPAAGTDRLVRQLDLRSSTTSSTAARSSTS